MLKLTEFIGKGAAPLAVSAENGKTGAESLKLKKPSKEGFLSGARGRDRTADTRIFSPLLYRLSYLGRLYLNRYCAATNNSIQQSRAFVKTFFEKL